MISFVLLGRSKDKEKPEGEKVHPNFIIQGKIYCQLLKNVSWKVEMSFLCSHGFLTGSVVELEITPGNWEMWEVLGKMLETGNGSLAKPDLAWLDAATWPAAANASLTVNFLSYFSSHLGSRTRPAAALPRWMRSPAERLSAAPKESPTPKVNRYRYLR